MTTHMRLEDWKREQMKDWRFRFWSIVLWPEFRWMGFKIRLRIWLLKLLGFENCPDCGFLCDTTLAVCGACSAELPDWS